MKNTAIDVTVVYAVVDEVVAVGGETEIVGFESAGGLAVAAAVAVGGVVVVVVAVAQP